MENINKYYKKDPTDIKCASAHQHLCLYALGHGVVVLAGGPMSVSCVPFLLLADAAIYDDHDPRAEYSGTNNKQALQAKIYSHKCDAPAKTLGGDISVQPIVAPPWQGPNGAISAGWIIPPEEQQD